MAFSRDVALALLQHLGSLKNMSGRLPLHLCKCLELQINRLYWLQRAQ